MAKTKTISAFAVYNIDSLRTRIDAAKNQMEILQMQLAPLEEEVISMLERGAIPANDCPAIAVAESEKRSVSWKVEFVARLGQILADKVLANTPAKTFKKLIINLAA